MPDDVSPRPVRRPMVADCLVRRVQQLYDSNRSLSLRNLADMAGCSHTTVARIIKGERLPRAASQGGDLSEVEAPAGRPERCPRCGSRVKLPCLRCQLQALRR